MSKLVNENVPHGWYKLRIDDVANIKSGGTPLRANHDLYFENGVIPWVKTMDLNNGYIYHTDEKITLLGLKESSCSLLESGTVLVAMYGGFNQIGRTGLMTFQGTINQAISALTINTEISIPEYILYWLNHNVSLWRRFAASSRKDPNITRSDVAAFPVLLPPLPEQRKIAEILSSWDEAIQLVEALIAALKARKQGLMQLLLTGEVRFPGFDELWEEVRLGEFGDTYTGLSGKTKDDFGVGKPYIPYKNIFTNSAINPKQLDYVTIAPNDNQNRVKYGDVFFTTSSETPDEVGMSSVLLAELGECYLNSFCFGYRMINFNTAIPEYLRYVLRSEEFRRMMYKLAQGSTRYNLSKREVMKIILSLPTISEQKNISDVLNDGEIAIHSFEVYANYLREQKKGLMQRLLTGEVRVSV